MLAAEVWTIWSTSGCKAMPTAARVPTRLPLPLHHRLRRMTTLRTMVATTVETKSTVHPYRAAERPRQGGFDAVLPSAERRLFAVGTRGRARFRPSVWLGQIGHASSARIC